MSRSPYASVKTNQRFERGWNRLQTSIEIFVALVVVAGLLGLLGTGPLSATKVEVPGRAISIDYQRVLRRTVQTEMTIDFADAVPGRALAVQLPNAFVRQMDIVSTSPRSSAMRAAADGVTYVFEIGDTEKGEITLAMKPKGVGVFTSRFKIGESPVVLHQLIWP